MRISKLKLVLASLVWAWAAQAGAWVKFCEEPDGADTGCDFNRLGSSGEKNKQLAVYHCKGRGSVADAVKVANACSANRQRNLSGLNMWSLSCSTSDRIIQGKDNKAWVELVCLEGFYGPDGRSIK